MKRSILSKVLVLALLGLFLGFQLSAAPQAVLSMIKGKVEVKLAGTSAWVPATEGMAITTLATVSTGFDATVTIVIDKTSIAVKPLTRMTVDKLVEDQGKVTTSCYLRVGSVQANVKSAEGVKQDFKVKSPYSTASVRGTVFTFSGLRLAVDEGRVAFIPGRPERDIELPEGLAEAPDLSADFAGAPEGAADPDAALEVSAGSDATMTVGPGGAVSASSSDDYAALVGNSTVYASGSAERAVAAGGPNPAAASVATAGQSASGFGSVRLTWTMTTEE
jgi:hypothetical protein